MKCVVKDMDDKVLVIHDGELYRFVSKNSRKLDHPLESCVKAEQEPKKPSSSTQARLGERNPQAKLTEEQIRAIRQKVKTHTLVWVAKEYGVTVSTIRQIVHRRTWGWVE